MKLDAAGSVKVTAKVAFARDVALGTAPGAQPPKDPTRKLELVVNGKVVASKDIPADDKVHDVSFDVNIDKSSWVALRHFPQMHTNAVNVIVGGKPIRASRESAKWCIGVIEQLWKVRGARVEDRESPKPNDRKPRRHSRRRWKCTGRSRKRRLKDRRQETGDGDEMREVSRRVIVFCVLPPASCPCLLTPAPSARARGVFRPVQFRASSVEGRVAFPPLPDRASPPRRNAGGTFLSAR